MSLAYGLSEEAFHKLQRAQESIDLMSILFGEVTRETHYTPQMISSFLEVISGDVLVVIQSVISEAKQKRAR